MLNTHVRPSRELRNNYPELKKLVQDRDHVVITSRGKGDMVLIGMDEFAEFEQYRYKKYIKEALDEAKEYAKRPDAERLTLDEVFEDIRTKYGF